MSVSATASWVVSGAGVPQMGWNSWNHFGCNINEELIKETVDAMIDSGLGKLGYEYINLDDCWQAPERDSEGRVQPDPERFPNGLKHLSDYVHDRGFKFGIYSSAGFKTCEGLPAALGYEDIDAASYAEWGVDYLKYDNCYTDHGIPQKRYPEMGKALRNTGRDIMYSLCEWGRENPATWAHDLAGAHSWRISGDIEDNWSSILKIATIATPLWRYAGPRLGYNDPDMLEVGNGGCTVTEYQSHFSMWAMLKAPLITGNDLRKLDYTGEIFKILSNEEVIAVDQDPLGWQSRRVWSENTERHSTFTTKDRLIAAKCNSRVLSKENMQLDDSDDQIWSIESGGKIRNKGSGMCLTEMQPQNMNSSTSSSSIRIEDDLDTQCYAAYCVGTAPCDMATGWDIEQYTGGMIISQISGRCLEVDRNDTPYVENNLEVSLPPQGKRLQTGICQVTAMDVHPRDKVFNLEQHQSWTFPYGNMLNLYQHQCLTVDRDSPPGDIAELWKTRLSTGEDVILLLNKMESVREITITWDMIGYPQNFAVVAIRDLWAFENLPNIDSSTREITVSVDGHGVVMLKLKPVA